MWCWLFPGRMALSLIKHVAELRLPSLIVDILHRTIETTAVVMLACFQVVKFLLVSSRRMVLGSLHTLSNKTSVILSMCQTSEIISILMTQWMSLLLKIIGDLEVKRVV